jgi:DNA-binding SARP family transcriptional activator
MPAPLAKLSPPRLARTVRRQRLHRLFDEGLRAPVVWIGAAAGSGKTTATAEYLASRKGALRWYRVDSGDLDLASFFYYLARTATAGGRKPLPIFGPEFTDQPVAFARRFFRDYYTRLPADATIVFDDLHVAAPTLLPTIVAVAIEELPPGFRVFLLSREQIPSTFAGFRATDRVAVVDDAILRFDDGEAAALVHDRLGDASELEREVQRAAQGWAAGLVLLSEQAMGSATPGTPVSTTPGQTLFDYFAREVYERLDEADRRFTALTALLPEFTAQAASTVTEREDAAAVLDDLYRRQLFITRAGARYVYHDLFRAFLLDRLPERVPPDELRAARVRAASAAIGEDYGEIAIGLLLDAHAWERAVELVESHGAALLRQGRRETLRAFVDRLPEQARNAAPRIDYWLGVASMIDDERRALTHFERAHSGFIVRADEPSACLAAAQAVLAIHLSWNSSIDGVAWVRRLLALQPHADTLPEGDRLTVATAMIRGASMDETYRADDAVSIAEAERSIAILERPTTDIDVNARLIAADALQERSIERNDRPLFERAVAAVTPLLSDRSVTSWAKCHWLIAFGMVSGRRFTYAKPGFPYATAQDALQEAWETARREELRSLQFAATNTMLNVAGATGDRDLYDALVTRLESECNPAHPRQVALMLDHKRTFLSRRGRYEEALATADASLEAAIRAQEQWGDLWIGWMGRAQVLIALRRYGEAAAYSRENAQRVSGAFRRALLIVAASADALAATESGAADYAERLRRIMSDVRDMGWANYMMEIGPIVARLWADALEHGIERAFIVAAIRRRGLEPPTRYAPAWPWRVRIRALGPLEVECDDVPLRFGARAQLKPLEVLKVLVAMPSHRADAQQLQSWLWPEATEDAAKAALEVAVHRLRKLLNCDDAVRASAGKLSLPPEYVWVDASAFEAWLPEAQRELDGQPAAPAADMLAQRLFRDYRGPLFGDDEAAPWSVGPRERLHQGFLRLAAGLGRFHEVHKDWSRAAAVYERGIAQDQLAEELYRGLIRCHLARNEPAAAMSVFRRCREILSVVLGIAPAAATRDLVSKVAAAGN